MKEAYSCVVDFSFWVELYGSVEPLVFTFLLKCVGVERDIWLYRAVRKKWS